MIDFYTANIFSDAPFTEWVPGTPTAAEGIEDETELEIDNQVGGFAE